MDQQLGQVVLLVSDYDEAIKYFVKRLRFELLEDTDLGSKRWVVVKPRGSGGAALLLAKAKDQQRPSIGRQTAGRVAFFLYTDDFDRDYEAMTMQQIEFVGEPREAPYGRVVVFKDLYGNKWDFIQRS